MNAAPLSNGGIRPYQHEDEAALLDLVRDVWPYAGDIQVKFRDRWWWQWEVPPLYVVEHPVRNNMLIGVCAYMPFSLRSSGRDLPGAWLVDFFVRPAFQAQGLGTRLTTAVKQQFSIVASFSQSDAAYRVFSRLGWTRRDAISIHANFVPLRATFRKQSKDSQVLMIADVSSVTADIDALWVRLRDLFPAIVARDAATILRRYVSTAHRQYALICAYRGSACVGYVVVRVLRGAPPRRTVGLIVDYLVHPDDVAAFGDLLRAGTSHALSQGATRIYCLSTEPRFQTVLSRHGFVSPRTPIVGRLLRRRLTRHITVHPTATEEVPAASRWFLTMGDCDIEAAWYPD